ncbi:MAG TPA: hypothetical protein VN258_20260 [Mobilitalea sp.]|nr:hypothetical protein [Mobilitalea sp.]
MKDYGCFINGDTVLSDKDLELKLRKEANDIYHRENIPCGSLHLDIPLALETELELLSAAGFRRTTLERRWSNTTVIKACK